ncbi:MAG TPA: amino acid permease [Streptosporangiaceae bacterium]|nr:amino acid permease [Streptosporangiaceae bacterium]
MRRAVGSLSERAAAPEGFSYTIKRRLLGRPLVNEQLAEQRLSNPLALGVLSPDGISSSAYGPEEILIALLPLAGLAAYALILPMTLVILFVMTLVVLSYREVVMVYIRPGGSYVVARENFGPRVAQVAAVALLIDYIVTVAVQTAGGAAAIVSAFPELPRSLGLSTKAVLLIISVLAILIMCYGNLRGIREAGRAFAVPTYLFAGSVLLMIVAGLIREIIGNLHPYDPGALHGTYPIGTGAQGLISVAMIFTLLRAFANGGASLTGIEAVSDAVGAFRPPEGINARRVLVAEGMILGVLVAGISWLAHVTRATPRLLGAPTVLAQEATLIFGGGVGRVLFYLLQAATALILFTGGNTSFNGFPFLASYVAGDAFLPRWLLKRGHRLVFSNAIIMLTVISIALIIIRGANVNSLVPLYAIGVFTAFSMAGFGMARYHLRRREPGWRRRLVINASAGALTGIVVVIFAVVKFTEGAWIVVVLFIVLVPALIRLNREYAMEADVLATISGRQPPPPPTYSRRTVFVFVDSFDLATLAALRYARSLRPTTLRAVHFVIDSARADLLREQWMGADRGVALDFVDVPDRRLVKAAADLVTREIADPGTHVTVILPRRSFSPLLGRLLHDHTADKIAGAVSRIPRSAATIIPYDVQSRLATMQEKQRAEAAKTADGAGRPASLTPAGPAPDGGPAGQPPAAEIIHTIPAGPDPPAGRKRGGPDARAWPPSRKAEGPDGRRPGRIGARRKKGPGGAAGDDYSGPVPPPGVNPIGSLTGPGRATVEGRVRALELRPVEHNTVLAAEVADSTGVLTALFYGRSRIPGVTCGARVRFSGPVGMRKGRPFMVNPGYELVAAGPEEPSPAG